ncbi:MAG: MFS transporter [Nitrospirae bacterium GWC2_57_9]|nr:MAG: MFS transporter [Nitrospirae bacterium GWC2_57_9]
MQVTSVIKTLFSALRHRNFRLFFAGQLVSLIGTWMQNVGQAWLVLELTQSSFKLGIVSALQFAPMLFLSFPAGVLIDYFPKRRLIVTAQAVMMFLALTLALLDFSGTVRYWHILILATVLGIANTVDMPARQSFIIEMVGKEDLMNAIALNSSIFNAARAAGPAIAGLLIGTFGTAVCFLVNGLSYLAVILGLYLMKFEESAPRHRRPYSFGGDIREGLQYIRTKPVILITILLVAVVGVFGANFTVLVPVFVRQELQRDAAAFGLLMSCFGLGALLGALSLALLSRRGPTPALLLGGGMGLSLTLIAIGFQNSYAVTAVLLVLAGWFLVTFFSMANTTIQLETEDRLRGRVMSIYTLTFGGLTPFGSLFAGAVAHWIKTPLTFALGGLVSGIVFFVVIMNRRKVPAWREE